MQKKNFDLPGTFDDVIFRKNQNSLKFANSAQNHKKWISPWFSAPNLSPRSIFRSKGPKNRFLRPKSLNVFFGTRAFFRGVGVSKKIFFDFFGQKNGYGAQNFFGGVFCHCESFALPQRSWMFIVFDIWIFFSSDTPPKKEAWLKIGGWRGQKTKEKSPFLFKKKTNRGIF